jgi:glycerol-3-phosphate dehydrogenase (NAD(P)+)
MRIAVLGSGAWGTALGLILGQNRHQVIMWGPRPAQLAEIQRSGQNERYLPGIKLPADWTYAPEIPSAVQNADAVVLAVPSKAFREVARQIADVALPVISVTKGIEYETGMTMTEF